MKHLKTLEFIRDVGASGSIRGTAERMNITPSALTRKIQDFEQELGVPVFERLPHGMRLNAAGELLIQHIRAQSADFERLRSQIADLSGARRGHVTLACSQAFVDHVLPGEIEAYRAQFPAVTFLALARDHARGVQSLLEFEADLALLAHPPVTAEMKILHQSRQPLCALMHADHPLAGDTPVRLRDCFRFPVAMPDHSLAIRHILDAARGRFSQPMDLRVESGSLEFLRNYVLRERLVSFQVSIGIPSETPNLHWRPIDERDIAPVEIVLGQLRGRRLSVAAAKFVDQLSRNPLWG
jgi:DNA-binding transcriptional LysR family regulator